MTDPRRSDLNLDTEAAMRLADGSLRPHERAAAEQRLRASAEGREMLEQQQRVVRALRSAGPVPPPALRAAVEDQAGRPRGRLKWLRIIGMLGARRWP